MVVVHGLVVGEGVGPGAMAGVGCRHLPHVACGEVVGQPSYEELVRPLGHLPS